MYHCPLLHCQERGRLLRMLQSYVLSPVLMQLSVLDEKDESEKIFIHSQLLQQQLVSKKHTQKPVPSWSLT